MDSQQATPYRQQLQALHTALLAQIVEQRGGVVGRAGAVPGTAPGRAVPGRGGIASRWMGVGSS